MLAKEKTLRQMPFGSDCPKLERHERNSRVFFGNMTDPTVGISCPMIPARNLMLTLTEIS